MRVAITQDRLRADAKVYFANTMAEADLVVIMLPEYKSAAADMRVFVVNNPLEADYKIYVDQLASIAWSGGGYIDRTPSWKKACLWLMWWTSIIAGAWAVIGLIGSIAISFVLMTQRETAFSHHDVTVGLASSILLGAISVVLWKSVKRWNS